METLSAAVAAPPTILFVSPVADMKGGAERVLLDLLENPSIHPALVVPGEGELSAIARRRGLEVYFLDLGAVSAVHRPPRPSDLLNAAAAARRCAMQLAYAARNSRASLVHTNGLKVHVVGALARRLHGVPVIAHVHDIPHTRLEKAIWHGIAAGVSRMVVVSRPCFPSASLPSKVAVVSNGVPTAGYSLMAPRSLPEKPTIGFVGRFHPFKGLHLLLDWFNHATWSRPDLRLLIRGRADAEGADYWRSLQPRVESLCLQGRCHVEGWAGQDADPYDDIDILAVPSETPDPAPRVIIEAMLRGIPTIGYPCGGIPALIGGPEYGALAADPVSFGEAVDRLLEPASYGAVSAAAQRRAREAFSLEHFWAEMNAQYRSVLAGS
jgi:glycosyltransferase involved in cell wall biosynthesis